MPEIVAPASEAHPGQHNSPNKRISDGDARKTMRLAISAVLAPSSSVELTLTEISCCEHGMRLLLSGLAPVFESTTSGVVLRGRGNAATSLLMDMASSDLPHRQTRALRLVTDIIGHLSLKNQTQAAYSASNTSALDESLNTRSVQTLFGIFKIATKKLMDADTSASFWEKVLFCFTKFLVCMF
jgi:hypothetical protein